MLVCCNAVMLIIICSLPEGRLPQHTSVGNVISLIPSKHYVGGHSFMIACLELILVLIDFKLKSLY